MDNTFKVKKRFTGIAKDFVNSVTQSFIGKGADPNDIIVQDLFNYQPPSSGGSFPSLLGRKKSNKKNLYDLLDNTVETRRIFDQLLSVYNEHIGDKKQLLNQSRQLFDMDIVQTIVDVIIDDGFNSFVNGKDEFKIGYELQEDEKELLGQSYEDEINTHIDEFVEKFAIRQRIPELIPELLRDGEHAWGVLFEKNKGIIEIVDDLDVIDLLPLYVNNNLAFVMKQDSSIKGGSGLTSQSFFASSSANCRPTIYKPDNIIFFRLKSPTKQKINIAEFFDPEYRQYFYDKTGIRLPKYIKVAKPIYYSAMKDLNRLNILQNVNTILDLYNILKPDIVSVAVPSTTTAQEASMIVRDFERQLNDMSAFTDVDSLDMATLASLANRRKILPTWLDGKGQITANEINTMSKTSDTREGISFLRNNIAMSVGVPPFYINIGDAPTDKAQTIKLYSRYTKKLTSLQTSIADGIIDLLQLHLEYKGFNISRDNLYCKFRTITSGDSLDDTDMMVATVTGINELYKGVEEISSSEYNDLVIDSEQFKLFYDAATARFANISGILKRSETKNAQDDDGESLGGPSDNFDDFEPDREYTSVENDDSYDDFEADSQIEPAENTPANIETNVAPEETPPAEEG